MSSLVKWLETYVLPPASRLAQLRWLVAMRDTFISLLPITMAGSIAMLFNSIIRAAKVQMHWDTFYSLMQPVVAIDNIIWEGTFALFAVYFAISWGYHLAKIYEVNRFAGSVASLVAFSMSISDSVKLRIDGDIVDIKNAFDIKQFSTMGLFTAIIFGCIGTALFITFYKARIRLKVDSSMPHAEWIAFSTLIPILLSIFIVGFVNYAFQRLTGTYFGNWLLTTIQRPLVNLGQGFGVVLLVTFLVQIFWFFGINGISVLTPVMDSLWLTPENINVTACCNILMFSKRKDYRTIAKMAVAPGIFNINEPIIFGLPVVFNPVYLIPFVVAPLVNVSLAYWATQAGLVNPVQIFVPTVMPPLIGPFLACNYDWRAIVLALINMVIALLIWMPFVFAADKIAKQDNNQRNFYLPQY